MRQRDDSGDYFIDANGCLAEHVDMDGLGVVVHYDDIPESDITTIHGLRVTTPLRTVIDIAAEVSAAELETIIRDCLDRGLFSIDDAMRRTAEPDVASRLGARLLRNALR